MKNLFETATAAQIKERIRRLEPGSNRQWGIGRILGPLVKSKVLKEAAVMKRNAPTAKSLVVADERSLVKERERLCALIDRFSTAGPQGCTKHAHTFFGPLTPDEWAQLMYKRLDHHLRQFGV